MKINIWYTDAATREARAVTVEAATDVVAVALPPQPGEKLPGLVVDVSGDAVQVHTAGGVMVASYGFVDLLAEAAADGRDVSG